MLKIYLLLNQFPKIFVRKKGEALIIELTEDIKQLDILAATYLYIYISRISKDSFCIFQSSIELFELV